jgi:hypothetical protein
MVDLRLSSVPCKLKPGFCSGINLCNKQQFRARLPGLPNSASIRELSISSLATDNRLSRVHPFSPRSCPIISVKGVSAFVSVQVRGRDEQTIPSHASSISSSLELCCYPQSSRSFMVPSPLISRIIALGTKGQDFFCLFLVSR